MKKLLNRNNLVIFATLFVLIGLQFILIKPFFHSGFFPTHDGVQTVRIFEYSKAFKYGQIPPRWTSDLLYGHGYPLFIFYGPFTYFIGAIFVFLGLNFMLATKLVFISVFFIGILGIYFLLRSFVGNTAALVGSIIYSLIPYRAVDVYVRGDLPEFLAFSLFPWILLANIKLIQKPKNIFLIAIFSLLSSILLITHNLATLIYTTFLIPFNLLYIFKYERLKFLSIIKTLAISAFLIILVTCFYWLPLAMESSFVQLDKFATYPYQEYFLSFQQIWQSPWGYNGFLEKAPMSLQFGQIILILSLAAIILNFFIKTKFKPLIYFLGIALFVSFFFETKLSQFIWDRLVILRYLQFPWRLHLVNTITGILLVGFLFYLLKNSQKFLNQKLAIFLIILIGIGSIAFSFKESFSFFKAKSFSDEPPVSETTTWNDEYMPKWVKAKPKDWAPNKIMFLGYPGELRNIEWGYNSKKFVVEDKQNSRIKIGQIFYPGWEAFVNSKRVDITYNNEQGLMTIDIPAGKSNVEFLFKSTWWRQIADTVSIIGLIIVLTLILVFIGEKIKKT